jgi:hypothetical protein
LFADGLLDKKDRRLRSIPFPTRRATFGEVKRVRDVLASVEIHAESPNSILPENLSNKSKRSLAKSKKIHRSKSRDSPKRRLPKVVEDLATENVAVADGDDDVRLSWQDVEFSTQSLSEFENTAPPPKKSNKKKEKKKVS